MTTEELNNTVALVDFVIFGGAGDLAYRKLLPAMYRAYKEGKIDKTSRIYCTVRKENDFENYTANVHNALKNFLYAGEFEAETWKGFSPLVQPVMLDITTRDEKWATLETLLQADDDRARVFYLSTPPAVFGVCCQNLSDQGLITDNARVVVEKPLGYDAKSAEEINGIIATYFKETQIFRIDHYLGKETVQNLMALRFSNILFEQFWNSKFIDHVQISISETVGLEGRAGFYDGAGALRDMVQNHLLQLLCLTAMEPPNSISADNIRSEKLKVLQALRPIKDENVEKHTVRGQYVAGEFDGKLVPGYLEELNDGASRTETFVAIRAHIDNWRWARVPFYLRTGKRMKQRCAEIVLQFREIPHDVYSKTQGTTPPNRLVIRLQPDENIQLHLMAKDLNDLDVKLQPVVLNLNFADTFENFRSDAYKRLMLDAALNNPSLFIHRDEVAAAWAWIDPIIEKWVADEVVPELYRAGTWGPQAANELIQADNRRWYNSGEGLKK
jgi:glucose-6-phosphate 1-dehydrogenase